jgi:DNA (cytosine-5)-methyltransferase 1
VKSRLLDLFCGAGGCSVGYARAGFEVVGVDIEPQLDYPFEFHQADALEFMDALLSTGVLVDVTDQGEQWLVIQDFDAIHASPPCPVHSSLNGWSGDSTEPDLIPQTRAKLIESGLPYVIENVPGAPLLSPLRICGQALGLRVRRHRLFETNFPMMVPSCWHPEPPVIVVGGSIGRKVFDPRRKAIAPSFELAKEVMGMSWVTTRQGVVNAIPPAYCEHVGQYLMAELNARATA